MERRDLSRFFRNLDTHRNDGCWEWQGRRDKDGYEKFWIGGRQYYAHRLMLEIADGAPVPSDRVVRHKCDNPPCANPEHLLSGTNRDNVQDRVQRDRTARGERNANTQMTEEAVREVVSLFATGVLNQAEIARKMGVSRTVISLILRGRTWKHLGLDLPETGKQTGERHWASKAPGTPRACAFCGKEFGAKTTRDRFCSRECQGKDAGARATIRRRAGVAPLPTAFCPECGTELLPNRDRRWKYCSHKCTATAATKKWKATHPKPPPEVFKKECPGCGVAFETTEKIKVYCTHECLRREWKRQQRTK